MFDQTILPDTLRAIQLASQIPAVSNAYLAGGTALALQIGHRISIDLDFFTLIDFDENQLEMDLIKFPGFKLQNKAWKTLLGSIGQTQFSFFYYKYPLLDKTIPYGGIELAGKKDLAAMKIHALSDRGTKRDFVDLFFLGKVFSLDEMLEFYNHKYSDLDDKLYHILRSLDYFMDAENLEERSLQMLVDYNWDEVKDFFHSESLRLAKTKL